MKVFQIRQDDRFAWYETAQEQMERMVNVFGWQGRVLELASAATADAVSVTASELSCVINWLENGRDPKDAAKELRLYCERECKQTSLAQSNDQKSAASQTGSRHEVTLPNGITKVMEGDKIIGLKTDGIIVTNYVSRGGQEPEFANQSEQQPATEIPRNFASDDLNHMYRCGASEAAAEAFVNQSDPRIIGEVGTQPDTVFQEPFGWVEKQTEFSQRLRRAAKTKATIIAGYDADFLAAADEIDRYYTGMLNWKATAEAKDAQPVQQPADLIDIIRGALVDDVVQYHSPEWVARARAAIEQQGGGELPQDDSPRNMCSCAHIGECDGSCAPYIARRGTSVQPESSRVRFEEHITERNPAASLNRHPNLHHLYALAWVNEAWLAWRKALAQRAASVPAQVASQQYHIDAERYRWLRDQGHGNSPSTHTAWIATGSLRDGVSWVGALNKEIPAVIDAMIDTMRTLKKKDGA